MNSHTLPMLKVGSRTQAQRALQHIDEDEASTAKQDAFHVDTGIIPQARLDDQGVTELEQLGLSVFNQDVFENGIMEQVDQALAKEEESRLKKILQRELTTINDDIRLAKKDLDRVNKAEIDLESHATVSRDVSRELESINKQKQNKIKQLSTLKVRRENVLKKLASFEQAASGSKEKKEGDSLFDQAFDVSGNSKRETEKERMIRTGEMTPFGTVVKTKTAKAETSKPLQLSEFERQMMASESQSQRAKKDFSRYLKKKKQSFVPESKAKQMDSGSTVGGTSSGTKAKKRNRFDENDWRVYDKDTWERPKRQTGHRINHSFSGDHQLSDEEEWNRECDELMDCDEGEDDYQPSKEELMDDSTDEEDAAYCSDEECDIGKIKRSVKGISGRSRRRLLGKRSRRPPKYRGNSDEEGPPERSRVKRDLSIRRERDDADAEDYQDRLLRQQKLDAKDEKAAKTRRSESNDDDDRDEDDSGEFDGGLRVPSKLWKKLYKYQKTGVRWLWELHTQQAGGIVGDEMGLGKTIQTIAFLAALRSSKVRNVNFPYKGLGPTIIVCPTTVMHQWLKECHKWWPEFRVAILHSSGSYSGSQSDLVRSIAKSFGILITSYSTLVIQQEIILRFNWHYVILDEGHKIRNPDAKVTLCCKQFRTPHRIILSGSPIQNNLKELWSLFDFVFPGKLGTLPDFMQHFSIPIVQGGYSNATQIQVETAYRCACVLRDTINPYLIRRMKADVKQNLNLPGKNEQVLFCRLTDEQKNIYQEYLESRECNAILQGKFQIFAGLIMLRKICNHPDLSTGGLQLFSQGPSDLPEDQFGHWSRSGKMIVVEALLRLWKKQDHRVLLFTQSKTMLNILEKFIQDQGYRYLTMDGGTSISARQPLIDQYNKDPSIYLFLLTTRVGGLGVNLTGADRVIIFDPDWNPSTDTQARERAWRIGQQRQVTIYRLLTSGTIEEKIYHRQIFKQFLTNRILKDPKQRRLFKSQDMYELFTLGNQDNKEGTETSALFAGTDSDVRVPKKPRKNRFDEIKERRLREAEVDDEDIEPLEKAEDERRDETVRKIEDEEDEDLIAGKESKEGGLDNSEIERMKAFARMLSRKMEMEKQKKSFEDSVLDKKEKGNKNDHVQDRKDDSGVASQEDQSSAECRGDTLDVKTGGAIDSQPQDKQNLTIGEMPCLILEHRGIEGKVVRIKVQKSDGEEVSSDNSVEKVDVSDSLVKESVGSKNANLDCDSSNLKKSWAWEKNGKKWTIPSLKKDTSGYKLERHDGGKLSEQKKEVEKKMSRIEKLPQKDDKREERRHKKKRKRDACFEGERIPNLVKHCPLAKSNPGGSENQSGASQSVDTGSNVDPTGHDDYVLRELFKKTGIHGAMKHDKIMESGRPDYAIVEAEAEKVAREAVAALRRSRQRCSSAMSGLPTWTGQHGAVSKPRFGQKKSSLLLGKPGKQESSSTTRPNPSSQLKSEAKQPESKEERLFDGSISGNVSLSSKLDSLSSNDLLSRIQARKRISSLAASVDGNEDDDEDDFLRPDRPAPQLTSLDSKDEELLQDIRNYVAFMGSRDGEASSQEIVLNFGPRLPPAEAPKFKAMLQQICELQPGGVWRLKAEFR
ncbi:DNA excision repair protein ercc-6-like [Plakobranchus ocellatus]|uniref:DNA excision repair protein ERCC-6 n=1 Tax=Plakobranchus ocellatus TaxID=259542 RepID=A0AAV4A460_9GAST|nr:DNA excision repair protein ercc-6-like [Plakobranchus ocellatus]